MRDTDYYHSRAQEERALAADASDPLAKDIHLRMSLIYDEMAYKASLDSQQIRESIGAPERRGASKKAAPTPNQGKAG